MTTKKNGPGVVAATTEAKNSTPRKGKFMSDRIESPRPPLAKWRVDELLAEADRREMRASEVLAERIEAENKIAARWEFVTIAILALSSLALCYFIAVGVVASLVAWGWSA